MVDVCVHVGRYSFDLGQIVDTRMNSFNSFMRLHDAVLHLFS